MVETALVGEAVELPTAARRSAVAPAPFAVDVDAKQPALLPLAAAPRDADAAPRAFSTDHLIAKPAFYAAATVAVSSADDTDAGLTTTDAAQSSDGLGAPGVAAAASDAATAPTAEGAAAAGSPIPRVPWVALAVIVFAVMPTGILASVFGPTIPYIAASYNLTTAEVGVVVTVLFAGTSSGDIAWLVVMHNRTRVPLLTRLFPNEIYAGQRLMSVGFVLLISANVAIFATSADSGFGLFLFLVFVCGFGGGLNSLSGHSIVGSWDERVAATAMALVLVGPGIGTISSSWIQKAFIGSGWGIAPSGDAWRHFFLFLAMLCAALWATLASTNLQYQKKTAAGMPASPDARAARSRTVLGVPEAEALAVQARASVVAANGNAHAAPTITTTSSAAGAIIAVVPASLTDAPADAVSVAMPSSSNAAPLSLRDQLRAKSRVLALALDGRYWLLCLSLFLCNGSVVLIGSWQYSMVLEKGYTGGRTATLSTSLFWGGLLFGRLVTSRIAARFARTANNTLRYLFVACVMSAIAPLGLVLVDARRGIDATATLVGFCLAPLNPLITALIVSSDLFAHPVTGSNAIPIGGVIISGQLGGLTLPAALGALVGVAGQIDISMLLVSAAAIITLSALLGFQSLYHVAQRKKALVVPVRTSSATSDS